MPYDLPETVAEIERQLAEAGWDQPPRLYALVNTGALRESEPSLADLLRDNDPDGLTPVEQEPVEGDVAEFLARIEWPDTVDGCAFVDEVLMDPGEREIRLVVGVLRGGERAAVLRIKAADGETDDDVVAGPDLVPNLATALLATLGEEPPS